jgi:allophanate hydrolase
MSIWIQRRPADEVEAEAAAVDPTLALAGLTVAIKDNIDVAGMATTCGCPAFSYDPERDATCVARLRAAGAVIAGKTNMDQFATGLVGTRSPHGAVADLRHPDRVGGGSSSGSAAAVAAGHVDVALGTDTAGSGRVPAAFQRIVGAKPSFGRVPVDGVVPACRSFDCVSVFASSVELAERVLEVIGDPPPGPLAAPPQPRLAHLEGTPVEAPPFSSEAIDPTPFLEAGALLYGGAFIAERYAAVGQFVADHRDACDPVVASIILAGADIQAAAYVQDCERLERLRAHALALLDGYDGLLVPTAPYQPTLAEVAADPVGANQRVGTYATFCNLIGLCAYALPSGVTVLARAGEDRLLADLARTLEAAGPAGPAAGVPRPPAGSSALLVVGAHMSGLPLNGQLLERGARLLGPAVTAAAYRLFALDTDPPKPGLVRGGSAAITGELWALSPAGLGSLLSILPQPMALGRVALSDGSEVVGFLCEPAALETAQEISAFGGWRDYLATVRT